MIAIPMAHSYKHIITEEISNSCTYQRICDSLAFCPTSNIKSWEVHAIEVTFQSTSHSSYVYIYYDIQ